MTTRSEESRLVAAIEQAVKNGISPTPSARPCRCDIGGDEIAIGGLSVELPTRSKTFVVCSGCFELYRMRPGPRPME
jgi:hypothetical protein